jgi:AcrR family transcriptional regulator
VSIINRMLLLVTQQTTTGVGQTSTDEKSVCRIRNGSMDARPKRPDRRIARTRQLLQQAFVALASEKAFAAITVGDITERANVNRGTFYAHFPDKYALLETIMREQFQALLARTLPPGTAWNRQALQRLIQTVLEYVRQTRQACRLAQDVDSLIERAAYPELTSLLVEWLQYAGHNMATRHIPVETIAHMLSWAIFGAAAQWCQQGTISSEAMAQDVVLVLMEGVSP